MRCRLRQVDIKAEHFERQVSRVETERDNWEKKYEDSQEVSRVFRFPGPRCAGPPIRPIYVPG